MPLLDPLNDLFASRRLVYAYRDVVIMKKSKLPDVTEAIEATWKKVNERISTYGQLTEGEVDAIIHAFRKRKRLHGKRVGTEDSSATR